MQGLLSCLANMGIFSQWSPNNSAQGETSYAKYFLGVGVEVSFFCNYFLLLVGSVMPTGVDVSLYLI